MSLRSLARKVLVNDVEVSELNGDVRAFFHCLMLTLDASVVRYGMKNTGVAVDVLLELEGRPYNLVS